MNQTGILLLAVGHPYYARYAHQLFLSIKAVDPDMQVAIAHDENSLSHLTDQQKQSFDHHIQVPASYLSKKGVKDYLKAKTFLYELSPFKKTLYIDSDVILTPYKKPSDLIASFGDVKFTASNRGSEPIESAKDGFIHWANPSDIMREYGINTGVLYNLASEMMYFEKCKEVKKLFSIAHDIYENPKIKYKNFAFSIPDELAFEIAMIKCNIHPHLSPFIPFYWEQFEKRNLSPRYIYENYYGYSIGGNFVSRGAADVYNALADHANRKFGINGYFPAKDKRSFLPERQVI